MEVLHEDLGEASMLCSKHPYRNNSPGGICAFCLQEKLGKLVSSSYPVAIFPSSSSSSSPSFRSVYAADSSSTAASQSGGSRSSLGSKPRLPFVKKMKKEERSSENMVSTATPRRDSQLKWKIFSETN